MIKCTAFNHSFNPEEAVIAKGGSGGAFRELSVERAEQSALNKAAFKGSPRRLSRDQWDLKNSWVSRRNVAKWAANLILVFDSIIILSKYLLFYIITLTIPFKFPYTLVQDKDTTEPLCA